MVSRGPHTDLQRTEILILPDNVGNDFSYYILFVLAIALVAVFAIITAVSPLAGEDYALSNYMPQASIFQRLVWVMGRSVLQIQGWNARFGEQLAIFWLMMPRFWFVATNTLAFVSFCCLIAMLARNSVQWTSGLASSTFLCMAIMYLLWPRLETFFWIAGTSNYLHPLTLTLIVLIPFLIKDCDWIGRLRGHAVWAMLPISFLAGESFEALPAGMLICMTFALWREWRRDGPYLLPLLAITVAYALGWIILMKAPSTTLRTQWFHTQYGFDGFTLPYLVKRTLNSGYVFLTASKELILAAFLAMIWSLRTGRLRVLWEGNLVLFAFGAIASSSLVIAAPYTEARSFSILWITLIVALIRLISVEMVEHSQHRRTVFAAGLGVSALAMSAVILVAYSQFAARVDSRSEVVTSRIGTEQCVTGVEFPLIRTPLDQRIMADREIWVKEAPDQMSKYFHCKVLPR